MEGKPTIPEVLPLIRSYYGKPGNECGGSLHVVLDDFNLGDDILEWCVGYAVENSDSDGVELAKLLLRMSKTQRRKLASMDHYDWSKRQPAA